MIDKKIALTFDYEPFLYKTGNIYDTLIKPTDILLKKLAENNLVATFFIDTLFLFRVMNDIGTKELMWKSISSQITEMHANGHELALHLHPHWLDAKYQDNEWDLSNINNYRIHSLTPAKLIEIIKKSIDVIHLITGKNIWDDYITYRAGGWTIQPFIDFADIFSKFNIDIDSSVSSGLYKELRPFNFDFRSVEKYVPYKFSEDVCVEDPNGAFLEVPITSYPYNFFMKVISRLDKLFRRDLYLSSKSGSAIQVLNKSKLIDMTRYLRTDRIMLSIDRMNPRLFKFLLKNIKRSLLVVISHPKDYSHSSGICLDHISYSKLESVTLRQLRP
jgi:peptidoglycan/xylan/chitin deacetylase (PgdA/CDA1 family)